MAKKLLALLCITMCMATPSIFARNFSTLRAFKIYCLLKNKDEIGHRKGVDWLVSCLRDHGEHAVKNIQDCAKSCLERKDWHLLAYLLRFGADVQACFLVEDPDGGPPVNMLLVMAHLHGVHSSCASTLAESPILSPAGLL